MSSRNNHNNLGYSQKPSDKKDSRDPTKKSPISNQIDMAYNNGPPPVANTGNLPANQNPLANQMNIGYNT
ncbi:hypothetical protein MtrunA17_Chr2g0297581 [Medicago truncatula]|uniref:Uncharacterized protein n=1 Tax=Medicago truncatula TaxID=3880 RepID=A0A396JAB7_MEDTR|nr:hypothetical protein MtrunA17_Chr2g0297581 [Medicago truncatula]